MCEEATNNLKLIGIWMSEKKFQKLRWSKFINVCRSYGYDLVRLDLGRPLEEQGSLRVFIHKLTDIIAAADQGDAKCKEVIADVEQYISNHPDMTVIDPLDNVRILLDRYRYYSLLREHPALRGLGVLTPTFCVLTGASGEGRDLLTQRGVTFPLVCKPTLAHGSKSAHSMCVIFNEASLSVCRPPCVLQSFVNHNAVLYKIFIIGNRYHITERPSLKNFYACNERQPIYFHSGDVCKADSQSTLSILDPHEIYNLDQKTTLDLSRVEAIIKVLRKELQLLLFGIDIVIDNVTNEYAIIDINVYPGYEGYPNVFKHLIESIDEIVNLKAEESCNVISNGITNGIDKSNDNMYRNGRFTIYNTDEQLINVSFSKINHFYNNYCTQAND